MPGIGAPRVRAGRFPLGGDKPLVLKDALADGNRPQGKDTLSVNGRVPNGNALHAGKV